MKDASTFFGRISQGVQILLLPVLALLLASCGPQASRYEVTLKLEQYCKTQGAEHLCDAQRPATQATDLFVEPDDDTVLIIFMGQHYLSGHSTPLYAQRRSRDEDASTGCARERSQTLSLEQGFWEIHGRFVEEILASGPGDSCGDLPAAERWTWSLAGPEKDGP